ncbi:hypothetical protein EPI10_001791 [Gossypium australe]|uniref:Uncharacterized protein n=1 Tax=Gossypium australe TaxID=47621 RepID=A0A5B6VC47_9ROSI|nr:hypothetical protein EPI10_001791 [Gossypium australe]
MREFLSPQMAQSVTQKNLHLFRERLAIPMELLTENSPDNSPLQTRRSSCGSIAKGIRRMSSASAFGKVLPIKAVFHSRSFLLINSATLTKCKLPTPTVKRALS